MSKEQKKEKQQPKSISVEDHKRELAVKVEAINQLKDELAKLKQSSLNMAKDYKDRFDRQNHALSEKDVLHAAAAKDHEVELAAVAQRIEKLNESHGKMVKKLRDAAAEAELNHAAAIEALRNELDASHVQTIAAQE